MHRAWTERSLIAWGRAHDRTLHIVFAPSPDTVDDRSARDAVMDTIEERLGFRYLLPGDDPEGVFDPPTLEEDLTPRFLGGVLDVDRETGDVGLRFQDFTFTERLYSLEQTDAYRHGILDPVGAVPGAGTVTSRRVVLYFDAARDGTRTALPVRVRTKIGQ